MKPHRVRMTHNLVLHYGLYKQLDVRANINTHTHTRTMNALADTDRTRHETRGRWGGGRYVFVWVRGDGRGILSGMGCSEESRGMGGRLQSLPNRTNPRHLSFFISFLIDFGRLPPRAPPRAPLRLPPASCPAPPRPVTNAHASSRSSRLGHPRAAAADLQALPLRGGRSHKVPLGRLHRVPAAHHAREPARAHAQSETLQHQCRR